MSQNVSLIIPSAGKSSRFPGKPKWLLTCPNGNLMIQECIKGLDLINVSNIYITFLKEHIDKYCKNINIKNLFNFTNKNIHILKLDKSTSSQSETVYITLNHFNIKGSIFIKDCDNYYKHTILPKNYLCYVEINKNNNISKVYNKSFIEFNNLNQLTNICEKQIISQNICVGGYSFYDCKLFKDIYNSIDKTKLILKELYISHIICSALIQNKIFYSNQVHDYIDWGTIEEWINYKASFKTLFVDLDGVLVYNSGEYTSPKWGETNCIEENVNYLRNLYSTKKVKIIITTARKSIYKQETIDQLKKHNIPYDQIIFDLYHAKRFLINDYSLTNQYPTAVSVNIKRDSNELNHLLS